MRVGVLEVAKGEPISFDVFFDYQCPFVYRAATLIDAVVASGARDVEVGWRYFSLTQVNSKDDGWTVWDAPASERVRGRLAFRAAEAAKRQGAFEPMHQSLLRGRHRDRLDLDDPAVIDRLAAGARLDMDGSAVTSRILPPSPRSRPTIAQQPGTASSARRRSFSRTEQPPTSASPRRRSRTMARSKSSTG
jgi:predicted DsbA family dithiol-disulfide isomerase